MMQYDHNYSMNRIAKKAGVSVSTVSLIARNKRKASELMSFKLQEASGIPRGWWRHPEEHQEDFRFLLDNKPYGK